MTQENRIGIVCMILREWLVCKLLSNCLKADSNSPRLPVCTRNKIVVRIANLIIRDVDVYARALLMTRHSPEYWDEITDFCTSLRENLIA